MFNKSHKSNIQNTNKSKLSQGKCTLITPITYLQNPQSTKVRSQSTLARYTGSGHTRSSRRASIVPASKSVHRNIRVGISTSWLGYELAWYDLVRVRVDRHPGRRSYLGHVPQLRPASTTATCRWLLWKKDVNMLRYKANELFSKMENIIKRIR